MSPRHCKYLGLSNESQIRNAKNVRVNAQVTAVVTILEVAGALPMIITHLLISRLGFRVFIVKESLFMLLHFVVLSYAFLMNTTSNKNRIIEDGWTNVLKNMVFCYHRNVVAPASSPNEASKNKDKIIDAEKNPDVPKIFLISKARQSYAPGKTVLEIFPKTADGGRREPSIEMQQATCSYYGNDLTNVSNEFTEKDRNVKGTTSIDSFRGKMISQLLSRIHDEDTYIKILTHFVDVEEAHKAGKDIDALNHNYEQLEIHTLPNFVGCSKRKSAMRTSKLQTLLHIKKETHSYNNHLEQFIDMEERFVESGC